LKHKQCRRFPPLFFLLGVFLLINGACTSKAAAPEGIPVTPDIVREYPLEQMSGKTAFEYFRDENIAAGWNLGNTLDSHSSGKGNETVWGNPSVNQAIMNGVKAAGFDLIRIPVTWMGHIGPASDYKISETRLRRVAEVVDMAHKAGLKVIINLHHDGSTEAPLKEAGWLSISKAAIVEKENKNITGQFVRIWQQIAAYFGNYGDWLMFESFNELHDGNWGEGSGQFIQSQIEVINQWNQAFTDAVRQSGGNNATRFLVIPGLCTKINHTLADYFVLPKDSAPERSIVTFHYYDPYEFGITGTRSDWGSSADKNKVVNDFAPFKQKYIDKKIPIIIGECGAVRQVYTDKAKEDRARQNRLDYLSWVFAKASENGLIPLYWDNGSFTGNGEKFGLFNRNTGQVNSEESAACIRAMIQAVK
jgi:endoglucanase